MKNNLREQLAKGSPGFGIVVKIEDPSVVEMVALNGFDFVMFDMEHTALGLETLQNHFRAALARGIGTLVRPPGFDPHLILRLLDIGAEGILVPGIRSQQEVAAVVAASRFPPLGSRGVSLSTRANQFGAHGLGGGREVAEHLNRHTVVAVMIEEKEAVDEIETIVATPGIDFAFIGPDDLSASLGHIGTRAHPAVKAAVDRVIAAAAGAGLPFATMANHPALPMTVAELTERGAALILTGVDANLLSAGLRDVRAKITAGTI
jgi:4-hydroxy-2-oxoheptanedioate aldolase